MKRLLSLTLLLGLACPAGLLCKLQAEGVLGGQLYATGGDIIVEVLEATAGYVSELHLYEPPPVRFIALNTDVGTTINLGSYPAGTELVFGIFVRNTSNTFYMGPASRNPDGVVHAVVTNLGPGMAIVGFEDLAVSEGPDNDYDDNVFKFTGGIAPVACPEDIETETDPGQCTAVVNYTIPPTDGAEVECDPPSGSVFAKGETTVDCTAFYLDERTEMCSFQVTVADEQAPQITCPSSISVQCLSDVPPCPGSLGAFVDLGGTASDNCSGGLAYSCSDGPVVGGLCGGTVTRTNKLTDASGNMAICTQLVTINDTMNPSINCPEGIAVQCLADVPACPGSLAAFIGAGGSAGDNCDGTLEYSCSDGPLMDGSCGGTITRTHQVTDDCGNSVSCDQTITVQDTTPPTVTSCPADAAIDCPAEPAFGTPVFSDVCDGDLTVTFADVTTPGNCGQPEGTIKYSVTRTWTATDDCGNSMSCDQTITVRDTTPPTVTSCPADTTIDCPAEPAFGTPVFNDACDGDLTVTFADVITPGNCGQPEGTIKYSVTRTWTATDDCGNSVSCDQTIAVRDTTPPTVTSCPADTTIDCPAEPAFGTPVFNDACDGDLTVTFADVTTPGNCGQPEGTIKYSVTRTWTATDDCGNSVSCDQTIAVRDTTPPTVTSCPADTTIDCPAEPAFGTPVFSDVCDGDLTVTFADVTTPGNCGQPEGTIKHSVTRTWTATDDCGNSVSCDQTITVQDTTPPTVTSCPADTTIDCPAEPAFGTPVFNDVCDGDLTVTFADVTTPGNCGQPEGTIKYSLTRTWTATDDCGNSVSCDQTITVQDTTPPTVTSCPADTTIDCPAEPAFGTPVFNDVCDGDLTVTFADVTTPGNCGQPEGTIKYSVTRTWTAMDDCGNSVSCDQIITVRDTTPPTVTSCPADTTIDCPAEPAFGTPVFNDVCDGDLTVTFADVTTPGNCGQPEGTIKYSVTRTWTATDDCGNSISCDQTVTVVDTAPPSITCAANKTIQCGTSWSFDAPTANDGCGAASITIVSTVTNANCGNTLTAVRTWRATDACGNSAQCSQTVTVVDTTPPSITCAANKTIQCGTSWSFDAPTANDGCGAASITIVSTVTNANCGNTLSAVRTWRATDACGNNAQCSQTVTVVDTSPPSITCAPSRTVECGTSWSFAAPTASDGCGAAGIIIVSTVTNAGCGHTFSAVRTWRATDACGNSAQCSQTVFVEDTADPIMTCAADKTVECGAAWSFDAPSAVDSCGSVTISVVNTVTAAGCGTSLATTRTWQADDSCGNSEQCSQTVTVLDRTPPLLVGVPAPETFHCLSEVPPPAVVTAIDSCDGDVAVSRLSTTNGLCPTVITHQWTAIDGCGNTAQASQTLLIQPAPLVVSGELSNRVSCPGGETFFCVGVASACAVDFQWFKDGFLLAGQNNACLALAAVTPADAGTYCVVASTDCVRLTNCATLTVAEAGQLPRLVLARVFGDQACSLEGVLVGFSEEMDLVTMENAGNYAIPGVTILHAERFQLDPKTVLLRTSPMQCGGTYSLTVRSVANRQGIGLCPNPVTITLATLDAACCGEISTLDLPAGYSLLANQLHRGGDRLQEVLPVAPELARVSVLDGKGGFETFTFRQGSWSGNPEIPPGDGFFLFLPEPASLTFMGSRPVPVLPLPLVEGLNLASRQVPERARYEDIVGLPPAEGTVLQRHIRGSSGTDLPSFYLTHIYRDGMWSGGDPIAERGEAVIIRSFTPVAITRQPVSQLGVPLNQPVVFSVEATGSAPLQYQWQHNGVNIPGATGPVFTLPSAVVEDGGSYNVTVANSVGAVRSETAMLRLNLPTLPLTNDFDDRVTVTETENTGRNNNLTATPEQGEFNHAGKPVGKSMWIDWRTATPGVATFWTAGSSFDTVLAAYTGEPMLSDLVEVHSDDDSGPNLSSVIRFQALPGISYHIVVDGYASDSGEVVLSWDFEPRPDVLPGIVSQPRSVVTGLGSNVTFTVVATGLGLTYQWFFNGQALAGETLPTLALLNAQATNAGEYFVRIEQGAQFLDSRIAVLEFSRVGPLNEVQNIFSADKFSDLTIEGGGAAVGLARANKTAVAQAAAIVRGFTGTQIFSTFGSINQPSEPLHCGVAGVASRWFAYVAPANGTLALNTEGSDFDTVLAVYTGTGFSLSNLTPLGCDRNNGSNGLTSSLTLPATLNTVYYVAVDGENGARGTVNLNYACLVPVRLLDMQVTPDSTSFKVVSTPGFPFAIERSSNYLNWVSLLVTNSPSGTNSFTDRSPPAAGGRFYRVIQTP